MLVSFPVLLQRSRKLIYVLSTWSYIFGSWANLLPQFTEARGMVAITWIVGPRCNGTADPCIWDKQREKGGSLDLFSLRFKITRVVKTWTGWYKTGRKWYEVNATLVINIALLITSIRRRRLRECPGFMGCRRLARYIQVRKVMLLRVGQWAPSELELTCLSLVITQWDHLWCHGQQRTGGSILEEVMS